MAENTSALDSHDWETGQIEIKPGVQATQQTRRRCSRHFIDEHANGALYAVHVGMLQFDRLAEEVTERWLAQACPGRRLESDLVDLEDRYREGQSASRSGSPERPEPEE
jgi:hypothetical protein